MNERAHDLLGSASLRLSSLRLALAFSVAAPYLAACGLAGCGGGPEGAETPDVVHGGATDVRADVVADGTAADIASLPETAAPSAFPLDANRLYADGLLQLDEGRLEEAWRSLRSAAFLRPLHEPTMRALADAASRLYAGLLDEARALLEGGRLIAASRRLRLAARVEPLEGGPVEAEALLARYGHELYGSEWLPRDEVIVREKREERIAERRRTELALGPEFVLARRRDVRVFTDVREEAFAARIHRLVDELRLAYASLFVPLGVDLPGDLPASGSGASGGRGRPGSGGLDIVIYSRRDDYEGRTGSSTTLGMFLPDVRASFFFFRPESLRENVPVLFHELCHQLDDRLLGMRFPPPWLQEGLAVIFETARVDAEGRIESYGELSPDAARRIRAIAAPEGDAGGDAPEGSAAPGRSSAPKGDNWWGLGRIVGTSSLERLHGTDAVHDFYAQASLLVGFLVSGRHVTREIFYELVERARRPEARPERAWDGFREVLNLRGETPEGLEGKWRKAAEELAAGL